MAYIPHLVTAALCLSVLILATTNLYLTLRYTRRDVIHVLVLMALGFQLMTIVFFVFNQTLWVVDQHDELVGSVSTVAWLLYDYLNLLFHLSCGVILYYYLECRKPKNRGDSCNNLTHAVCPIHKTPELDTIRKQLGEIANRGIKASPVDLKENSNRIKVVEL